MRKRVADVGRDGADPVLLDDRREKFGAAAERLVPAGLVPFAAEITRLCRGAIRMYGDPAVREAIPGLLTDLRANRPLRRVLSDRLEAAARGQLAGRVDDAIAAGTARAVDPDALMDVIAGGAWYAVCVRRVTDVDSATETLADLVLHGVLA